MSNTWLLLLPELILLAGALVVPFLGFYFRGRLVRPAGTIGDYAQHVLSLYGGP